MQLMSHQNEALEFLSDKESAGLFFEMGLGKTLVMLEHLQKMLDKGLNPFPCLIVAPLSVVSVWEKEVIKFEYPFKVAKLLGTYRDRLDVLSANKADIYIINYEGLRVIGPSKIMDKGFQSIILDESHRIKNRGSQQSKIVLSLGHVIPHRFILTGTPVSKSPEDIWSQASFIHPGLFSNFWAFRGRHIDFKRMTVRSPGGLREVKLPYRFKHLEELEDKISTIALRKTKAECLDLPEKIYKTIYCPFTAAQKKHYFELKNSLSTMIQSTTFNINSATTLIQKLQQICQGFIYNEKSTTILPSGKFEMLKDLLEDIDNDKIILFAWYEADIKNLYENLKDKYNVVLYDGSSEERSRVVDKFQDSKEPIIFLAQLKKAEVGITLTAAKHVIYYGNSWSYETRVQSEDRAHRTGQKNNVIYYDFVIPNTVDELVIDSLKLKENLADKVTGDSRRLAEAITNLEYSA